jgi:hypothetical protein
MHPDVHQQFLLCLKCELPCSSNISFSQSWSFIMTYFPCGSSIAQVPFPLLNNVLPVNIRVVALQELIGYEKQGDIYYLISTEHVIQYWVMTDAQ